MVLCCRYDVDSQSPSLDKHVSLLVLVIEKVKYKKIKFQKKKKKCLNCLKCDG